MYSSSINTIYTPFPHLTSTINGFSPPNFFPQEKSSPDFLQNRHDLLHGLFYPYNAAVDQYNVAVEKPPQRSSKNKNINTVKRDRHSKIFTAHGPRDRRVRLSMEIARKFFDLQDMLGFDKASKTLDWLFTNSKESIKELVHTKMKMSKYNNTHNNTTTCRLFEMVCNSNNGNDKIRDAFDMSSRESRAKARARARSRTREKMRAREIMGVQDLGLHDLTTTTSPNQSSSRSWPQIDPIPDFWDISTHLTPPEPQYHGKP